MNSSDNSLLVNALPLSESIPKEPEKLAPYLDMHLRRVANSVNGKESALYPLLEIGTFKSYFTVDEPLKFRNVYRFNMDMYKQNGSANLTAGNTYSFAHGISGISVPTLLIGTGTDTAGKYVPIPFVSTTANAWIQLHATSTNIVVTMGSAAVALTQCYVLFEYTKN